VKGGMRYAEPLACLRRGEEVRFRTNRMYLLSHDGVQEWQVCTAGLGVVLCYQRTAAPESVGPIGNRSTRRVKDVSDWESL
jgi:hypothetical protein